MVRVMHNEKPKIDYPCTWQFKVIGRNKAAVRTAVSNTLSTRAHTLVFSNTSRAGKFHSFSIDIRVESEEDRNLLLVSLAEAEEIVTVL